MMRRRIRRSLRVSFVFAALVLLPACGLFSSDTKIDAKEILPSFLDIAQRHDAYVQADENLTELEKEVYLNSSQNLRATLEDAAHPPKE